MDHGQQDIVHDELIHLVFRFHTLPSKNGICDGHACMNFRNESSSLIHKNPAPVTGPLLRLTKIKIKTEEKINCYHLCSKKCNTYLNFPPTKCST